VEEEWTEGSSEYGVLGIERAYQMRKIAEERLKVESKSLK